MARSKTILAVSLGWWCGATLAAVAGEASLDAVMHGDDECAAGEACALNALQLRGQAVEDEAPPPPPEEAELGAPLIADADPAWEEAGDEENGDVQAMASSEGCHSHSHSKRCGLYSACRGRRYCVFGGYMVVPGSSVAGMESINAGNAHHYNYLWNVAQSHCGHPGCVLMTNPVGHRTQDQLHIHFRPYSGLGLGMHSRLQAATCHAGGWVPFSTGCCGCGYSKARAFSGFPGVFSEVSRAFGSMASVGISVWFGCGKTIVLATSHCSIEHSVSAR